MLGGNELVYRSVGKVLKPKWLGSHREGSTIGFGLPRGNRGLQPPAHPDIHPQQPNKIFGVGGTVLIKGPTTAGQRELTRRKRNGAYPNYPPTITSTCYLGLRRIHGWDGGGGNKSNKKKTDGLLHIAGV